MKTKLIAASLVALMLFGCNSNKTETTTTASSNGLFGKAASVRAKFETDYEALKEKAKTEVKSPEDLLKLKDEMTKLEESAKKDFSDAVASMTFPIPVEFVDSTDGKNFKVLSVQITEMQWDMAKVAAKVQMFIPAEKTAGGQVIAKYVYGLMVDKDNKPAAEGQKQSLTFSSIQDYAVNDTVEFNNAITNYGELSGLAKFIIKDKAN
ncbi:MAG TPA: hypothetical protein PK796_03815 [Bacteroidales bacterium]|jgi:hypothetical protein|nr:hypothetical protein [Bacteroidales bacterium]